MSDDCTCLFGHEPGEICRGNSPIPEECSHWKGERIIPCIKCGIPTVSTPGRCPLHIRKRYNKLRSMAAKNQKMAALK
ncbi:373_t:CDS:2 [Entrophospora sp. SA101]|nr:373_t:CDS:2 [Entrophospora sp. SA101]CAJ0834393.1 16005_t:CDS:2 [Entrophospora sp. SA101]